MDAIYHGIVAVVTATGIALAALFGTQSISPAPAKSEPVAVTVTVCGQGGIVPPNADGTPAKPCHK